MRDDMRDESDDKTPNEPLGDDTDAFDARDSVTPTDLQSLLLEVYRLRAAKVQPAALLAQHEQNRFVRPAAVDPQV